MAHVSAVGLTINAYENVSATEIIDEEIADRATGYGHKLSTIGGFLDAQITLVDNQLVANTWFNQGLGRHIEVLSPTLDIIWEGFVNTVEVSFGESVRRTGPVLDIVNSVNLSYTKLFPDIDIPLIGVPATTGFVSDTDSIAKFFTLQKYLTAGEFEETEAIAAATRYLNTNAYPKRSRTITLGQRSNPTIRLSLLGYWHLLNYPYDNTGGSGTVNANVKIGDILDADPNSIFSSSNATLAVNTAQQPDYEDQHRKAQSLIKAILSGGDLSFDNYNFGIYAGQEARYELIPSTSFNITYEVEENEKQFVVWENNRGLDPWEIEVGKWAMITGAEYINIDPSPNPLEDDMMFFETVTYTYPNGLIIDGTRKGELQDRVGRIHMVTGGAG